MININNRSVRFFPRSIGKNDRIEFSGDSIYVFRDSSDIGPFVVISLLLYGAFVLFIRYLFFPIFFYCLKKVFLWSCTSFNLHNKIKNINYYFQFVFLENYGYNIIYLSLFVSLFLIIIFSIYMNKKAMAKILKKKTEKFNKEIVLYYTSSAKAKDDIINAYKQLPILFEKALKEFNDKAYGPFWDIVEKAAIHFNTINSGLHTISQYSEKYKKQLKNESHNFPQFSVSLDELPDPSKYLSEFHKIVRMGQTNFEFARIWESRATRKVLVAGFNSLNDAIENLSSVIENSMSDVRNTLSYNTTSILNENSKTREVYKKIGKRQVKLLEDMKNN